VTNQESPKFFPKDRSKPFFSYGVFRPGELAYFRLKRFVRIAKPGLVARAAYVRDGLLIADESRVGQIEGDILYFSPAEIDYAYSAISDLEPTKQYSWGITETSSGEIVNILWGKRPRIGSNELDYVWSSWEDPIFNIGLSVVREQLKLNQDDKFPDLTPTFKLQMAYFLLWSSLERYASFRYYLGGKPMSKILKVSEELAFGEKLREVVTESREIVRADDPSEVCYLVKDDPKKSINYYYQVRSNIVHHGKGMRRDHRILFNSTHELLQIFEHMLASSKKDSGR